MPTGVAVSLAASTATTYLTVRRRTIFGGTSEIQRMLNGRTVTGARRQVARRVIKTLE